MTERKVAAAFIAPHNSTWQQACVNVLDDGSWWIWSDSAKKWVASLPPIPQDEVPRD